MLMLFLLFSVFGCNDTVVTIKEEGVVNASSNDSRSDTVL